MKQKMTSMMVWLSVAVTCAFAASAMAAQPLVDVAWIKEYSCDPNVRVLDIRNSGMFSKRGLSERTYSLCDLLGLLLCRLARQSREHARPDVAGCET